MKQRHDVKPVKQVVLSTANLAQCRIAGCCHLADLMAQLQRHSPSILKVTSVTVFVKCCKETKMVTNKHGKDTISKSNIHKHGKEHHIKVKHTQTR